MGGTVSGPEDERSDVLVVRNRPNQLTLLSDSETYIRDRRAFESDESRAVKRARLGEVRNRPNPLFCCHRRWTTSWSV
jgi:hypothetical protein